MGELKYDFSKPEILWGQTDLYNTELEKMEHERNFHDTGDAYVSILDGEPVYESLMNFPEEKEDSFYAEGPEVGDADEEVNADNDDSDDDDSDNRNSYRDTDQDNVYYLI